MRDEMPTVAGWIDELREAFGAAAINDAIRAGMAGHPTFFARENGHQVGTEIPHRPECCVAYVPPWRPETNKGR